MCLVELSHMLPVIFVSYFGNHSFTLMPFLGAPGADLDSHQEYTQSLFPDFSWCWTSNQEKFILSRYFVNTTLICDRIWKRSIWTDININGDWNYNSTLGKFLKTRIIKPFYFKLFGKYKILKKCL